MHRRAFTLLELLFVIMIIAILSATALPKYVATIERARSAEASITIGSIRGSIHRYWYDQKALADHYRPGTFEKFDIDNPNFNTNRFYNYYVKDKSRKFMMYFVIRAERIGSPDEYWMQWLQIGNNTKGFTRSRALGGHES